MTKIINIIGIGLDGGSGLSNNIINIITEATILVGSNRHLSYFPNPRAKQIILGDFILAVTAIKQHLEEQEKIVILVSGDPLFFGLGRFLLEHFSSKQLCFYPHLTSLQLAFSRIKIPWQDANIISVHGRDLEVLTPLLHQGVEKIAILTDNNNSPSAIARFYLSLDLPTHYDFWICENLADIKEKITHFSALELEGLASLSSDEFSTLNVVILQRQKEVKKANLDISSLPLIGLPDETFLSFADRPGLMTKREIRLLILGELNLQPQQIIWDIGAGIGSVSIEIARLSPSSHIYSIEKTAMGSTLIEQNCQRLQISNITSIHGNAPNILTDLPNPHRIFIGGTGGKLSEILAVCEQKLLPNAILVLALTTLEHLNQSLSWFSDRHWHYRLLQAQISRSIPVGQFTRLSPLNPVTIIQANRHKF